jgi:hypothetical protein
MYQLEKKSFFAREADSPHFQLRYFHVILFSLPRGICRHNRSCSRQVLHPDLVVSK